MNTPILALAIGCTLLLACEGVTLEPRFKGVPRFGEEKTEAQKFQEEANRQIDILQADVEKQVAALEAEIQKLQRQASQKGQGAQDEANRQVKELEAKKHDLQSQIEAATRAGEDALKKIEKALQDAVKQAQAAQR